MPGETTQPQKGTVDVLSAADAAERVPRGAGSQSGGWRRSFREEGEGGSKISVINACVKRILRCCILNEVLDSYRACETEPIVWHTKLEGTAS